jgi:hypothetical protein
VTPATPGGLTPEDDALLTKLAATVVRYRMTVPAIFFLESVKPLSFIGSQALVFFEPFVRALFAAPDYDRFATLMERRENLEALLVRIEQQDAVAREAERGARARARAERRARAAGKDNR